MSVAVGKLVYEIGSIPCSGAGLRWSKEDMDLAIEEPVTSILFDDKGKANIKEVLAGLAETDFAQEGLRRILNNSREVED